MGYGGVTCGEKPAAEAKKNESDTGAAALVEPIDDPPVLILFEGLLIGHYEGGSYYVGVLPTLGHQFSILIEEYKQHPTSLEPTVRPFREPVSKREIAFQEVSLGDRKWTFEVQPGTGMPPASTYLPATGPDRLSDIVAYGKDYRWAIRLDNRDDFPLHFDSTTGASKITIEKNALRPVIQFKHGLFHNRGHIEDVFRVPEGQPWERLGRIGMSIGGNIETISPNSTMVMKIERAGGFNEEIFRVTYQPTTQYKITIRNTSDEEQAGTSLSRGHFQVYYLAAHTASANRYDLRATADPEGLGAGAPNPYRCGIGDVTLPIL